MMSQLLRYVPALGVIASRRPRRVLEVGSGAQGLGRFHRGRFVGVDRDFADYTGHARPTALTMQPVRADAGALPFRARAFDVVLTIDVLEHVPPAARTAVIRECARVGAGAVVFGFPSGAAAQAHDRDLRGWLLGRGLPVPGWLVEHLAHPYPSADDVRSALAGTPARLRVVANAWLPLHRLAMRAEARPALARYSALLADLLAPSAWRWRGHRPATNLLRVVVRPLWPLLRLAGRRPGYRAVVVVDLEGQACSASAS